MNDTQIELTSKEVAVALDLISLIKHKLDSGTVVVKSTKDFPPILDSLIEKLCSANYKTGFTKSGITGAVWPGGKSARYVINS